MQNESDGLVVENYFLDSGFIYVGRSPTVISTVLGSSIAVCIYDREKKVGGMNHYQFPFIRDKNMATARYGNVANLTLIRMMINDGSKIKNLEAQLFGGANDPNVCSRDIGHENITAAKMIIARENILIVSEDVDGEKGRKVIFNTSTNEIAVIKVDTLRKEDWYPYEKDR